MGFSDVEDVTPPNLVTGFKVANIGNSGNSANNNVNNNNVNSSDTDTCFHVPDQITFFFQYLDIFSHHKVWRD